MSVIKRQTILGTIYSFIGVGVGTLTMALIVPNFFTKEEYGLINLISKWMLVLVSLMSLGYNNAGIRFFHVFRNKDKNHNGYLFNGLKTLFIGALLSFAFLYFFKDWIQSTKGNDNALFVKYYWLILPIAISTALFNLFDNYAKGLFDTVFGIFLSQLFIRFMVFMVVMLYIFKWIDFNSFVYYWAVAMSLPFILMVWHAKKLGGFSLRYSRFLKLSEIRREFYVFSAFSVAIGLSSLVVSTLDNLMVYNLLGLGLSGVYGFCLLFGSVMTMSYYANIKASTSIVTTALDSGDFPKIQQIFQKSGTTQLMVGIVLLTIVWATVDSLFSLIKPEYAVGKMALIIIGISKLYDLASGINTLILAYSKYYKYDSILVITFIVVLYGLNLYFIPKYGLEGAAIATLIATIYYNTARNLLIWKFFKIHPYSIQQLKVLLIGLLILGIGLTLPELEGALVWRLLNIVYKSLVMLSLFIALFYFAKVSIEINEILNKIFRKFKF